MARRSAYARTVLVANLVLGFAFACVPGEDDDQFRGQITPSPEAWVPSPLAGAYCEILVTGKGIKDMETDYLPRVVTCENNGANLEALKAQAIAARSVAYYAIAKNGEICDSQGCQVYTCAAAPTALAIQAVQETSGLYLNYNGVLTYAFYVAGDNNTSLPSCVGTPNVGTENWVTYNEGKSGTSVEQTDLGWVFNPGEPGFGQNRGCLSQWGSRCLENGKEYDYEQILRFYYGSDIQVTQAQGACILELGGDGDGDDPSGDGDGEPSGDGDGDASGEGDGDGDGDDPSGDGDGEPSGDGDPSDDGVCELGGDGCPCTNGGGCDLGLSCVAGICEPLANEEDETGGLSAGGFPDDAFGGDSSGCSTGAGERGGLAGLALLGLLGLLRRRSASMTRAG